MRDVSIVDPGPTLEQIKQTVALLKRNAIAPRVVKSKAQAADFNEWDRDLGLRARWKVGDEYFLLSDFRA